MVWLTQNTVAITITLAVFSIGLIAYTENKKIKRREFESIQKSKGLVNFIDRLGKEHWKKPSEVEKMKKEDAEAREKESLLFRVVKEIEDYRPAREKLGLEYNYQLHLFGWLQKTFHSASFEKQKGSSRPDIVIDDIAIEIKGPTGGQELKTIADKAMRYSHHFSKIIVVLFELNVNSRYYDEWKSGLEKYHPNVEVIVK